jgi:signal transduction histidine kinase
MRGAALPLHLGDGRLDVAGTMTDNSTIIGEEDAVESPRTDALGELDELRMETEELRASRTRLVLAADTERRLIERALHDGLQQQLIGLATDVELAARSIETDPDAAMRHLTQMRSGLREALEESRMLASRIHPALDAGGLGTALRFAAASAGGSARIDVDLGTTSIPSEVLVSVYFCCVDVLERATDATTTITVREQAGALTFEVIADGEVAPERSPMRDRVEAMRGGLTISSSPGPRTVWAGSLPT